MSIPKLSLVPRPSAKALIVVGAVSDKKGVRFVSSRDTSKLAKLAEALEITGAQDSFTTVIDPAHPTTVLAVVGLGSEPLSPNSYRYAGAVATRKLAGNEVVAFDLGLRDTADIEALAEGAALGSYSYNEYKSTPEKKSPVSAVEIVVEKKVSAELSKPATTSKALSLVKNLVNTPPNDLYPASFVEHTLAAIKGLPIKSTVWDEKALVKDGFGGIVGVGKGSSRPPRLVKLVYAPKKAKKHIAIVGKGITFDTGGLSLKTGAGMIGMKYDMTGAASTLAIITAAAELKLNVNITAWLCLAENMPSSTATRPNDVLTIHGGKTVEVLNTDAEGRLVLADGLVAASKEHPDLIIDIATLTGAATTALGTRYTGVMGDTETISHLVELGKSAGENFWHMPLPEELRAYLNSDVADIANVKPGNTAAGMLVGATFLKDFVGKTSDKPDAPLIPWVHLDIANTANNAGGAYGYTSAGPTGVAVRTLINLAESYATA
ncbi:leucyl aminopeptidase [Aurantimicrobium minutum]|uniref:leucyl aminopeptidase n=1 Tax=Aurantimicrobium minutum TaxID=708131 RepID=UPI002473BDA7|nr:leucyl aminopeptidase [Aurantimicrobium minutum]MDH6255429.1 leucyl aminopeptidase [Aurantimicrobium minutum]